LDFEVTLSISQIAILWTCELHFCELYFSAGSPLRPCKAGLSPCPRRVPVLGKVPVKNLAQEVVEVHVSARHAVRLAYPQPGVQRGKSNGACASFVTLDGRPAYRPVNLVSAIGARLLRARSRSSGG
jgi:hypothetical protein